MIDLDDLGGVFESVETLSSQWILLTTKLGVKMSSLELIEQNYPRDAKMCLCKALGEWLKLNYKYQRYGRPSWKRLVEAVKNLDSKLFEDLAKKHVASDMPNICHMPRRHS